MRIIDRGLDKQNKENFLKKIEQKERAYYNKLYMNCKEK